MFKERKSCPICESKNISNLKNKYNRETIIKFLEIYYNKKLPDIIYKEYEYKVMKCKECVLQMYMVLIWGVLFLNISN